MVQAPKTTQRPVNSGLAGDVLPKPRLVFFKYKWATGLPDFLLNHTREHVACLSQFFDVFVIDEDCDYQKVCDEYEPDLALFESGINISTCRRINIDNVQRYANVPKLGFFNADGWCESRSGILSEMDHWQIDTYFSIAVTAGEHTPAISGSLFVWPNGVDSDVYYDYAQPKVIPILLSGATGPQYPWRRRVFDLVSKNYPTLSCPHLGYTSRSRVSQVLHGEAYARTLNAAVFAPACGTVAKEIVRKHFEIPGCGTCLITEKSPGLAAAGFKDMENCVFADEHDVLEKIAFLFENPDALSRITRAGYDLVQSRHTFKHRNQVLQWLRLHQSLKPGERIIQPSPFEPLTVVDAGSAVQTAPVISNGLHLSFVREGNEFLWSGEYQKAEASYRSCLEYMRRLPEAKLGLAASLLHQAQAQAANDVLAELLQYTLAEYNAADPDPVEWAYYILTSLCLGDVAEAINRSKQFPGLNHPELARVRWVTTLFSQGIGAPFPIEDGGHQRVSLHQLPVLSPKQWSEQLANMLRVNGQPKIADAVLAGFRGAGTKSDADSRPLVSVGLGQRMLNSVTSKSDGASAFRRRLLYSKVRRRLGRVLESFRNGFKRRRAAKR